MSVHLEIPDTVADAMRLPGGERRQRMLLEFSVSLHTSPIMNLA